MPQVTIGVPKEVKLQEGRVALTPKGTADLITLGARVIVEEGAGAAAGFLDAAYRDAGALRATAAHPVWTLSDVVLKVKEPLPCEYYLLGKPKLLFTYLHLAGNEALIRSLVSAGRAAIAYEDVVVMVDGKPTYPLLAPMSRIAGVQAARGAIRWHKGRGCADYSSLTAVVIAGGVAGEAALNQLLAEGIGSIALFEKNPHRVQELAQKYQNETNLVVYPISLTGVFLSWCRVADIVVSAPMLPAGQEAPIVLTRAHTQVMKPGTYVVDISIDQNGSTEVTRGHPTKPGGDFAENGVEFSAVPNIPGSTVPDEATRALTDATFPYVKLIVEGMQAAPSGLVSVLKSSPPLRAGVQAWEGHILNESVAKKFGLLDRYVAAEELFK